MSDRRAADDMPSTKLSAPVVCNLSSFEHKRLTILSTDVAEYAGVLALAQARLSLNGSAKTRTREQGGAQLHAERVQRTAFDVLRALVGHPATKHAAILANANEVRQCLRCLACRLRSLVHATHDWFGVDHNAAASINEASLLHDRIMVLLQHANAPITPVAAKVFNVPEAVRFAPLTNMTAWLFWVSQFSSARIHELLQSKQMHDADRIRCALAEMDICRDGKVAFAVPAGLFVHALWLFWMRQGETSATMPACVQVRLLAQLCDKKITEGIGNAGQGDFPACGEWVSIRSFDRFTRADPTAALHELAMRVVDPGTAVYTMGALDWSLLQHQPGDSAADDLSARDFPPIATPTPVAGLLGRHVVQLSCGGQHCAAVCADDGVYTWGRGGHGRLGHGDEISRSSPTRIEGCCPHASHRANSPICNGADAVKQVSCGFAFTMVVDVTGNLYAFGAGENGRLGTGDDVSCLRPTRVDLRAALNYGDVQAIASSPQLAKACRHGSGGGRGRERVLRAAAGSVHTCVLSTFGRVFCCGKAEWCGFGDAEDEFFLRALPDDAFCGERVQDISVGAGGYHTLALTHSGEVFSWGHNRVGQLGCADNPTLVDACASPGKSIGVRVQNVHTCTGAGAEAEAGSPARTIGAGDAPAGHGAELERRPVRVQSMSARGVVALSAGWGHSAAVTASGGLWLCGRNFRGQLGMGDPVWFPKNARGHPYQPSFREVMPSSATMRGGVEAGGVGSQVRALPGLAQKGHRVRGVSCGGEHTAVLLECGDVLTCGAGHAGQLGHGDTEGTGAPRDAMHGSKGCSTFVPRRVERLRQAGREVLQLSCGSNFTAVLLGHYQPLSLVELCAQVAKRNKHVFAAAMHEASGLSSDLQYRICEAHVDLGEEATACDDCNDISAEHT